MQARKPGIRRLRQKHLAQLRDQRIGGIRAPGKIGKARIAGEIVAVDRRAQPLVLRLVHQRDHHPAVGRLIGARRHVERARRAALQNMLGDLVAEQGRRRLAEIDVDPAAGADGRARKQRGRDGLEGVDAGDDVGDRGADPVRGPVVADIDRHQAGKRLRHGIRARPLRVGTALAERADREIDQAGIVARQFLVADPEPRGDAGPKTLDQDVAISRQPPGDRDPVLVLHIEAKAALAAVIDRRQRGMAAIGRAEKARPVPLRRLDLDDVGAVDAEQHRAIGRGDALPEIEHAQAAIRRLMRRR